jgi:hypothetical protein
MAASFSERCDAIEECYEFLLAYAGQGLPSDEGSKSGAQVRGFLGRAVEALLGITESCAEAAGEAGLESSAKYHHFVAVMDRDARDSLAALELVLAQDTISSQLIDNLNASIHIRALLTDLFLFDEILKAQRKPKPTVTG